MLGILFFMKLTVSVNLYPHHCLQPPVVLILQLNDMTLYLGHMVTLHTFHPGIIWQNVVLVIPICMSCLRCCPELNPSMQMLPERHPYVSNTSPPPHHSTQCFHSKLAQQFQGLNKSSWVELENWLFTLSEMKYMNRTEAFQQTQDTKAAFLRQT